MTPNQYFDELVKAVGKHTTELFPSVVLAQAILESGLFTAKGPSGLAIKYNNWFGIKASKSWTGKVTPNLSTEEDDGTGNKFTIKAGFRWYDSIEESVKDHNNLFKTDFSKSFYKAVLNATTPSEQAQALQGTYATDSAYASKLNAIITRYNLTQYDKNTGEVVGDMVTAKQVISEAKKYVGANKYSTTHKAIINHYNTQTTLPRGTRMTYDWDWCAAFVSFILMKVGLSKTYGTEISVGYYKDKFIKAKIWKGRVRPKVGDIIIWNWDGSHTGWPHHIGFVSAVSGDTITTLEGNTFKGGVSTVGYNTFRWNASSIQGYARPNYGKATLPTPTKLTFEQAVQAVINGSMGNGETRVANIKASGNDATKVQAEVNKRLSATTTPKPTKTKEQAVKDVISGKYGSGKDRHDKLTKEGFDADEIQKLVNEALKPKVDFSGHKNTIKLSKDLEILDKVGGKRRGLASKGTTIRFDEVYINKGLYIAYLNGDGQRCYIRIADMVGNKIKEIFGVVSKA